MVLAAGDGAAAGEGVLSKLAVTGNGDAFEACAIRESRTSDGNHAVRNGDAGQADAVSKSQLSDGSNTVGDGDAF